MKLARLIIRPLYPILRRAINLEAATDAYQSINPCAPWHKGIACEEECRDAARLELMSIIDDGLPFLYWGKPIKPE